MWTKEEVFRELQARGADRVIVGFSGGNDEGGVDSIRFEKAYEKLPIKLPIWYPDKVWVGDGFSQEHLPEGATVGSKDEFGSAKVTYTGQALRDKQLLETIGAPVYAEYGSFAGDFYVSGTVVWDRIERRVSMHKQQYVPTSSDYDYDL